MSENESRLEVLAREVVDFLQEVVADDYWSESKARRARTLLGRAHRTLDSIRPLQEDRNE